MISVVVPIFNERDILPELRRRLTAALESAGEAWEVILVDDGSQDGSTEIAANFHNEDPRFKLLTLSRNFGHQPAVSAGVHHATGDCVVLIDGDLQDPPEVIPQFIERWKAGAQVVVGIRRTRAERGARGIGFKLFYPLLRRVTDLPDAPPDAGIFGLMDRAVVDEFNRFPERNRFIPGLRSWVGFRQDRVEYDRLERASGKPRQTFSRLLKYATDAMVSFSTKPLRAATYAGFVISGVSFLLAVYYVATFFIYRKQFGTGFTTTIVVVLFLGGVQLISVGILGEYVGRIYEEVKQRPLYIVKRRIGVNAPPAGAGSAATSQGRS